MCATRWLFAFQVLSYDDARIDVAPMVLSHGRDVTNHCRNFGGYGVACLAAAGLAVSLPMSRSDAVMAA